ncbi:DsbA family oxidoreductase [Mucilaginibacter sp.]|uniref:DsbA family oxidoreductase n=1 Tax=Mucilaginibacter sp. TaxID=1882438 RepID=UPI000CADA437|nr:DsbA family oxidoreductase [Mucilaginibacter sp.]PLW88384.1 MAG: disulfide bond formation protein DsbA [Mucilaginibacter sp.]HEK21729.1 DsbA family oxidoreductase [Bacteroidota bacterium]
MKVEIWSDVMCPFCYIGKRRFEAALQQFPHKDKVEVEWKSFQLNPDMQTDPNISINQYLADVKGWTLDYARQMNNHVTQMAAEVGLTYNMDKAVVANSFKAHRFTHLAKKHGLGEAAEEALFKAYFTDSRNVDDDDTLIELGVSIGLDAETIKTTLETDAFADEVRYDIAEAQQLGIRGVPFFVMDQKYGVSGAQANEVFSQTLDKAFNEWNQQRPAIQVTDGPTCGPDGNC